MAVAIDSNRSLTSLDLYDNGLGIDGALAILHALGGNSKLHEVNLRCNALDSAGCASVLSLAARTSCHVLCDHAAGPPAQPPRLPSQSRQEGGQQQPVTGEKDKSLRRVGAREAEAKLQAAAAETSAATSIAIRAGEELQHKTAAATSLARQLRETQAELEAAKVIAMEAGQQAQWAQASLHTDQFLLRDAHEATEQFHHLLEEEKAARQFAEMRADRFEKLSEGRASRATAPAAQPASPANTPAAAPPAEVKASLPEAQRQVEIATQALAGAQTARAKLAARDARRPIASLPRKGRRRVRSDCPVGPFISPGC